MAAAGSVISGNVVMAAKISAKIVAAIESVAMAQK